MTNMTKQEAICGAVRLGGALLTLASLLGLVGVPTAIGLTVIILGFAAEKVFDQIDEANAAADLAEMGKQLELEDEEGEE